MISRQESALSTIEQSVSTLVESIHISDGSVYTAIPVGDGTLIGGSVWKRREIAYTAELAKVTQGILYSLHIDPDGSERTENVVTFPSMVNEILPVEDGIIVCCKHGEQTFNLFDQEMQRQRAVDDPIGGGVYEAIIDQREGEVVAASRNGRVQFIKQDTLQLTQSVPLTDDETRIWSVAQLSTGDVFVAGDYNGIVTFFTREGVEKAVDLSYLAVQKDAQGLRFHPSIFGLAALPDGKCVVGSRWGQIVWFDEDFFVEKTVQIPDEISLIVPHEKTDSLLIGTREGKLLQMRDSSEDVLIDELLSIAPSRQHDNTLWSISFDDGGRCIAAFADGQVVRLAFPNVPEQRIYCS